MRIIRLSIIFFISVFLLILALLNRQYVDFRFFPVNLSDQMGILGGASIPLFLLILGSVLLGLFLGFFGEYLREHKHRKALSQKTKKVKVLENEIKKLKNINNNEADQILELLE